MLDAMHGLIRALQEQGDFDGAIAVAHRLLQLDPEEVLAHTSLSILYQHKGMIAEAEAEALKAKLLGWKKHLQQQKSETMTKTAGTHPAQFSRPTGRGVWPSAMVAGADATGGDRGRVPDPEHVLAWCRTFDRQPGGKSAR